MSNIHSTSQSFHMQHARNPGIPGMIHLLRLFGLVAVTALLIGGTAVVFPQTIHRKVREQKIAEIDTAHIIRKSLAQSPDGRTLAYVARDGHGQYVVVQGSKQKSYDGIGTGGIVFSANSKRTGYLALTGDKF